MNALKPSEILRILSLPLGKKIDQQSVERWSQSFWGILKREETAISDNPFVMMFPPPNITGNLHLGHALTAAIQDALLRHRCMDGKGGIWIPGFDHAGLATQKIIEGLLWRQKGKTRNECSSAEVMELANEWRDVKRDEMRNQLAQLGLKLNHEREYFTMDQNSSLAVNTAFQRLFKSGKIYRAIKPVYWSRELNTTLSDIEVERVGGVERYIRTGEIVEKHQLSQWFVNTHEMAHKAVELVENASISMIPSNYKRSWSAWLIDNGVKDWCISRQSWWGHKIPAFKIKSLPDKQESWIVADSIEDAASQLESGSDIEQDSDVLDTWFSSSLLPLTVSGWPDPVKFKNSVEMNLFPLDIMETGFDILSYWVSKMVMMSCALENKIPFKLILLHGMICDSKGKKMSKSKGNVIDPLNVINGASLGELQQSTKNLHKQGIIEDNQLQVALDNQGKLFPTGIPSCGADGLRAYLLSHDVHEEVVRIQIAQINKIRKLSNKIWNIFRFVLNLLEESDGFKFKLDNRKQLVQSTDLSELDQQVLRELYRCVSIAHTAFNQTYLLHSSFNLLEQFWTVQLSERYIGANKAALLNSDRPDEQKLQILVTCLTTATKLLHPFMPHITEFLYQKLSTSVNLQKSNDSNIEQFTSLTDEPFPRVEEWKAFQLESSKSL